MMGTQPGSHCHCHVIYAHKPIRKEDDPVLILKSKANHKTSCSKPSAFSPTAYRTELSSCTWRTRPFAVYPTAASLHSVGPWIATPPPPGPWCSVLPLTPHGLSTSAPVPFCALPRKPAFPFPFPTIDFTTPAELLQPHNSPLLSPLLPPAPQLVLLNFGCQTHGVRLSLNTHRVVS